MVLMGIAFVIILAIAAFFIWSQSTPIYYNGPSFKTTGRPRTATQRLDEEDADSRLYTHQLQHRSTIAKRGGIPGVHTMDGQLSSKFITERKQMNNMNGHRPDTSNSRVSIPSASRPDVLRHGTTRPDVLRHRTTRGEDSETNEYGYSYGMYRTDEDIAEGRRFKASRDRLQKESSSELGKKRKELQINPPPTRAEFDELRLRYASMNLTSQLSSVQEEKEYYEERKESNDEKSEKEEDKTEGGSSVANRGSQIDAQRTITSTPSSVSTMAKRSRHVETMNTVARRRQTRGKCTPCPSPTLFTSGASGGILYSGVGKCNSIGGGGLTSATACAKLVVGGPCGNGSGGVGSPGGGDVSLVPLNPNTFDNITTSVPILIDISGPGTVFSQDTFIVIYASLSANALSQQPGNITGWVINNANGAYTLSNNVMLDALKAAIAAQPGTTTMLSLLLTQIRTALQQEYKQQQRRLAIATGDTVIKSAIASGINNSAALSSLTMQQRNLVLATIAQKTYEQKVFDIAGDTAIIETSVSAYNEVITQILAAPTFADIPVSSMNELVQGIFTEVNPALNTIAAAVISDSDVDFGIAASGDAGLFALWRAIVGGNETVINTATINAIWAQYLYYEGLIVTAVLLMVEAYHSPYAAPDTSKAVAIVEKYAAFLMRLRDSYAPPFPVSAGPVILVYDDDQEDIEWGQRSGTAWYLQTPAIPVSLPTARAAAAVLNVGGLIGWSLPTVDDVSRLLSTKPPPDPNQDPVAPITTDFVYLLQVGLGYNFDAYVAGPTNMGGGLGVRFWTSEGFLAYVDVNSPTTGQSLIYSSPTPQTKAIGWAVRRFDSDS